MAPHSSTLAWKIPWAEEPGRLQSMGSLESDTTERLHFQFSLSCIGEGNGNPLQCSCLKNPRDGGAWWAAIYGVAQSRTRLKQLSSSSSSLGSLGILRWYRTPANAGDTREAGLILGLGRSLGGGQGNPLQYSCLENLMDRGSWWATIYRVAKSQTQLSNLACPHLQV